MSQENVEPLCLHCVFAEFEPMDLSGEWGEQTGCGMDMLDKFHDQGVELKCYEDTESKREYCGIPDRVCVYCRPKAWAEHHGDDADLKAIAREEVRPHMGFIVIVNNSTAELQTTLASIAEMAYKPVSIVIVFKSVILDAGERIRPSQALGMIKTYMSTHNIDYRMEFMLEHGATDERVVDIAYKKLATSYFATFVAGTKVPTDFISEIDIALNDKLEQFLMLLPIEGVNGMVVQTAVAKQIGGSTGDFIGNKLQRVAEEQECPYLVRPVTELVPSMKSL